MLFEHATHCERLPSASGLQQTALQTQHWIGKSLAIPCLLLVLDCIGAVAVAREVRLCWSLCICLFPLDIIGLRAAEL